MRIVSCNRRLHRPYTCGGLSVNDLGQAGRVAPCSLPVRAMPGLLQSTSLVRPLGPDTDSLADADGSARQRALIASRRAQSESPSMSGIGAGLTYSGLLCALSSLEEIPTVCCNRRAHIAIGR